MDTKRDNTGVGIMKFALQIIVLLAILSWWYQVDANAKSIYNDNITFGATPSSNNKSITFGATGTATIGGLRFDYSGSRMQASHDNSTWFDLENYDSEITTLTASTLANTNDIVTITATLSGFVPKGSSSTITGTLSAVAFEGYGGNLTGIVAGGGGSTTIEEIYLEERRTSDLLSTTFANHTRAFGFINGIDATSTATTVLFATLNTSNQIIINEAGIYAYKFRAPHSNSNGGQVYAYDVGNTVILKTGESVNSPSAGDIAYGEVSGRIIVTTTATLEMRHWIQTGSSDGLCNVNFSGSGNPNTYTLCSSGKITKLE